MAGANIGFRNAHRQKHQHRPRQVRLGFMRHIHNDRHEHIAQARQCREDHPVCQSLRKTEDNPHTGNAPQRNRDSGDDIESPERIRMIQVVGNV